jgi:hypothetical protein
MGFKGLGWQMNLPDFFGGGPDTGLTPDVFAAIVNGNPDAPPTNTTDDGHLWGAGDASGMDRWLNTLLTTFQRVLNFHDANLP